MTAEVKLNLNENALIALQKRYFIKNRDGEIIEDWESLCRRIANFIATDEKTEELQKFYAEKYFDLIYNLYFLPNTPTLMNAGKPNGQLAACFVLGIEDSMKSIMKAVTDAAMIHKCIYSEQFIETKAGIKKARDVTVGDYLMSPNGPVIVKKIFNTGIKECYRIFNDNEKISVIVGKDHPVLTKLDHSSEKLSSFREIRHYYKTWRFGICREKFYLNSELPKGFIFEEVLNGKRNNYNDIILPKVATKELMYFLGAWFGDGSKDYLNVSFTGRKGIKDYFINCVKNIFGLEKFTSYSKPMKTEEGELFQIGFNSKKLSSYMDFLGFFKDKDNIPEWINNLSIDLRASFLQGLFDTDGSSRDLKDESIILCSNKNEQVCISIAKIAESCGLRVSYTNPELNKKYNRFYYHVYVFKQSINKLRNLFNLNLPTRSNLLINKITKLRQYENVFYIPMNVEKVGELETIDFEVDNNVYLLDKIVSHNSGGGTGFDFSRLRPANSVVATTTGTASGPVSFMRMINNVTEEVKQGGTRRGANMGTLRIDHPDIFEFINCKKDTSQITNFNISINITDEFMKAVEKDRDFNLIDPRDGSITKTVRAKDIFDNIVKNAWLTGEPGVLFIDTINKDNKYGTIYSTNPCSEQPLRNNEACNLGSINIEKYFVSTNIDFALLKEHVQLIVRFLDSVVSLNCYPLEEIKTTHAETRKIGLGIMGFADILIVAGIKYGSNTSYSFAENIWKVIYDEAYKASELLGKEKGICKACESLGEKRRNYMLTTIAPTGSISIIAGCSSGIEPLFAVSYIKNVLDGKKLIEFNPYFIKLMEENGIEITKELRDKISSSNSIQEITEIPKKIRELFITAHDLTPEQHVKMQAIFQKYSDSGVSKTVNMCNSATIDDVRNTFLLAYKLGCKGITVYRDGSRPNQVLSVKKEEPLDRKIFNRTSVMEGYTEKIKTTLGNLLLTINKNSHGHPCEVILNIGKSGADVNAFAEGLGRLISISLQHGIPIHKIAKQLKQIKGEDIIIYNEAKYTSILDLIGRKLEQLSKGDNEDEKEAMLGKCPSCGERMYNSEGCSCCQSCGYSKC